MLDSIRNELPFKVGKGNILKSNNYFKGGHWSQNENMKFTMFVDFYRHVFTGNYNNRQVRIFVFMAEFMKTRNSVQCRTHFQKMMRQYNSVPNMIKQIRQLTGQKAYQTLSSMYACEFQGLKPLIFDKISDKNLKNKQDQEQNQLIQKNTVSFQNSAVPLQLQHTNSNFFKTSMKNCIQNLKQVDQEIMKKEDLRLTNDRIQQIQEAQQCEQFKFNLLFGNENRMLQRFNPPIYNYSMDNIYSAFQQLDGNLNFIPTDAFFQSIPSFIQKPQRISVQMQKEQLIKEKNIAILECQQHWIKWITFAIKLQELTNRIQSLEQRINEHN